MPIRLATTADIPIMARIKAAAFAPDGFFQILFPHKAEHPDAYLQGIREGLWSSWYNYSRVLMVSYELSKVNEQEGYDERSALLSSSSSEDDQQEILTGLAVWERVGKGWEHVHGIWGRWDPRLLIKPLLSRFFSLRQRIFPNKAATRPTPSNPNPITIWNFWPRVLPFGGHFFSAPHRQVHWSLESLAVHPDHQGKGVGKELVKQGLERAKHDPEGDLPVGLVASAGKEGFYQKCGFHELVGYMGKVGGSENPLYGVEGGAVLWTK